MARMMIAMPMSSGIAADYRLGQVGWANEGTPRQRDRISARVAYIEYIYFQAAGMVNAAESLIPFQCGRLLRPEAQHRDISVRLRG